MVVSTRQEMVAVLEVIINYLLFMSKLEKVSYVTVRTNANPEERQRQLDNANDISKFLLEGYEIASAVSDGSSIHYVLCLKANILHRTRIDAKITHLSGSGTSIAELQSKINELIEEINKLKSEMNTTVGGGH